MAFELIEASAGTGKTYSITSRYLLLLIEQGLQVGQILVVTFTEAATAELRDRIRSRVRDVRDAVASRALDTLEDKELLARLKTLLKTDDDLVQAARPGVRGAGDPGGIGPQPLRRHPHTDVLQEPEDQARRVPGAGPILQPIPLFFGPADGRSGWSPESDRSWRAHG